MPDSYGIIGHPLGHSLSPVLHNWGFRENGLDAVYEAWPVRPFELAGFMDRVRRTPILGLSVTIPHKRAVMALLDGLGPRAEAVGAVNTIFWRRDELLGENTDVLGIAGPLRGLGLKVGTALVLGAGGAARAAVAGLRELGAKRILVANRTRSRAEALARDLGAEAVDWEHRAGLGAGLIINATPLGLAGDMENLSPWPDDAPLAGAVVFDLVYNPLRTRLLARAEAQGCMTVSGLEMFVHQGLAQFEIWTGRRLDPDAAKALLLRALGG
ncbi:MAG: shikimate dehydrogenase [Desulfovibrionaceae bacterium]|nr:shikimate dehydrogenase [Desulfovibrionaceae bacterium]